MSLKWDRFAQYNDDRWCFKAYSETGQVGHPFMYMIDMRPDAKLGDWWRASYNTLSPTGEFVADTIETLYGFSEAKLWCEKHWQNTHGPEWVADRQFFDQCRSDNRLWTVGRPVLDYYELDFIAVEYEVSTGQVIDSFSDEDRAKVIEWAERRCREDIERSRPRGVSSPAGVAEAKLVHEASRRPIDPRRGA